MTNEDIQRNLLGEGSNTVTAVMVDIQIEYLKQHFLESMAFLIGNINRLFIGIAYYQLLTFDNNDFGNFKQLPFSSSLFLQSIEMGVDE